MYSWFCRSMNCATLLPETYCLCTWTSMSTEAYYPLSHYHLLGLFIATPSHIKNIPAICTYVHIIYASTYYYILCTNIQTITAWNTWVMFGHLVWTVISSVLDRFFFVFFYFLFLFFFLGIFQLNRYKRIAFFFSLIANSEYFSYIACLGCKIGWCTNVQAIPISYSEFSLI